MNHDAHIKWTMSVARLEYHHAYHLKDYATATHWSILWFECTRDRCMTTAMGSFVSNYLK